jgi:transcriptional regulator with XRE-family HTH domain
VTAGFEAVLLETRHVKAALAAMTVKTDRRDARGIAQLLPLGWYRSVHPKSASAQEVRSLFTARKFIYSKLLDIESGIRGVPRGFGLKIGPISRGCFEARIRDLAQREAMMKTVVGSMLAPFFGAAGGVCNPRRAASPDPNGSKDDHAKLAKEFGVSRPTIWSWEAGRSLPRKNNLRALRETMNVSENELILDRKETPQHHSELSLEQQIAACRQHIAKAAGVEPDAVEIVVKL